MTVNTSVPTIPKIPKIPKIKLTPEQLDHHPIGFGKYATLTPSEIAEANPSYIVWAYVNCARKADGFFGNDHICSELLYKDCIVDLESPEKDDKPKFRK